MGKSVVVFDTNSGVNFTRKKRKMIGNNQKKPEVKQFNAAKSPADDSYDGMTMCPVIGVNTTDRSAVGSWRLFHLSMPSLGTDSFQRIGNSIFLKCFRIKGYITVKGRISQAVRWRLKLVKFIGEGIASGVGAPAQVNNYLQLLRNHEGFPTQGYTAVGLHGICEHNFYKAFKLYPKTYDWHSKVIASGTLPGVKNVFTYTTSASAGTNAQYTFGRSVHLSDNAGDNSEFEKCNIPIDVMVTLNDRVTWRTVDGVSAIMSSYYLVLEEDFGVGIHITPGTASSSSVTGADWHYSNNFAEAVARFSFFVRGYFTDD